MLFFPGGIRAFSEDSWWKGEQLSRVFVVEVNTKVREASELVSDSEYMVSAFHMRTLPVVEV